MRSDSPTSNQSAKPTTPTLNSPGTTINDSKGNGPTDTTGGNPSQPNDAVEVPVPVTTDSLIFQIAQQKIGDFRLKKAETRKIEGALDAVQLQYAAADGRTIQNVLSAWPAPNDAIRTLVSDLTKRQADDSRWLIVSQENREREDGVQTSNVTLLKNPETGQETVQFREGRIYCFITGPKELALTFFSDLTQLFLDPIPGNDPAPGTAPVPGNDPVPRNSPVPGNEPASPNGPVPGDAPVPGN